MEKRLNMVKIAEAMAATGLNNSCLAEKLSVSRTIVGEWLSGRKFPRPDKLIRLGLTLRLAHGELVVDPLSSAAVVNFRKKAQRTIGDDHYAFGVRAASLLDEVAEYLPEELFDTPPLLSRPRLDYDYIQSVASKVRAHISKKDSDPISYNNIIKLILMYNVIPVPVFWGGNSEDEHDAHCMHIKSPISRREWVYINLDSHIFDFKFWVAHEIGHVLSCHIISEDESEDFAELFAQSFLFPGSSASLVYSELHAMQKGKLVQRLIEIASKLKISPYTIFKAVNSYAANNNEKQLPALGGSYVAIKKFVESQSTLIENLSPASGRTQTENSIVLKPKEYIDISEKYFHTSFFKALTSLTIERGKDSGFIKTLLNINTVDAKELHNCIVN